MVVPIAALMQVKHWIGHMVVNIAGLKAGPRVPLVRPLGRRLYPTISLTFITAGPRLPSSGRGSEGHAKPR
jgi:hypothetical protein